MLALLHRRFQLFLVTGKQSMNLAMRFIADRVNLRTKFLSRIRRVLIEQRLDIVMVLLKQRPNLLLLFRRQLEIFREASKFLIDRLWRMDMLELLTRCGLLCPIILSDGGTGHCDREHNSTCKCDESIWNGNLLETLSGLAASAYYVSGNRGARRCYCVRSICHDRADGWLCGLGWLWPFC
jgi:hypothetical protein